MNVMRIVIIRLRKVRVSVIGKVWVILLIIGRLWVE